MTAGSDFRDKVVDALCRDLVGPLVDPSGRYPGVEPTEVDPNATVMDRQQFYGLLVHPDGQEVLPYPPTTRYGIGVLYPRGEAVERQIDIDQGDQEVPFETNDESLLEERAPAPPDDLDFRDEPEEQPEEAAVRRSLRPSAIGVSFMLRPDTPDILVTLAGARYESRAVQVEGEVKTLWHRVPIEVGPLPFDVAPGLSRRETITEGLLTLEIGLSCRGPDLTVTCFARNITRHPDTDHPAGSCVFQVELRAVADSGAIQDYPSGLGPLTLPPKAEDASFELLYSDHPVKAVGHGCDAKYEVVDGQDVVKSQALPQAEVLSTTTVTDDEGGVEIEVGMEVLSEWDENACTAIDRLIEQYGIWIKERQEECGAGTATDHLDRCRDFLADVREGWQLAQDNDDVQRCLRWTSHAMAMQQQAYGAALRSLTVDSDGIIAVAPKVLRSEDPPTWRSFQIAFLLANLAPAVNPGHRRRATLDVIWMPTGGGKTEAYLALAAFTMLWRRLHAENKGRGLAETVVMMRYTLRLLTAQQLQRTASLICALEIIRQQNKEDLGRTRFTVGAWLGIASTPNKRRAATEDLIKFKRSPRSGNRPFLLSRCPWCGCDFFDQDKKVHGYDVQQTDDGERRMRASCPNPVCEFHIENTNGAGLPVYEVDEDIYDRPTTFLIGTVDKFAMLAWRREGRSFFGLSNQGVRVRNGPDLIIQDELHLITGPLGSLVGLYEAGIDTLCRHDGGMVPRIIAATATTRAYKEQTLGVFGAEEARLLPPPGIRIEDSYFSHVVEKSKLPPRVYLGVCATGLGKFPRIQARVFAGLAHAVGILSGQDQDSADYYWTNLAFFGSLRDLGTAKSLIATDLRAHQWKLASTTASSGARRADSSRSAYRYLQRQIELTSASSHSASEALDHLLVSRGADLALATSVVEVGVDVQRLGLLTIVHQPKTAATYIQVSGRVGRSVDKGPGLVVVLLNPSAGRDVSHYERFTSFHERLYEAVEPATVTPFTDAALERGLRGVMASVVRQTRPIDVGPDRVSGEDQQYAAEVLSALKDRARLISQDPDDAARRIDDQWAVASSELQLAAQQTLAWGEPGPNPDGAFLRTADVRPGDVPMHAVWPVLTSLRNVDATAGLRVDSNWVRVHYRPAPALAAPAAGDEDEDEEEDW